MTNDKIAQRIIAILTGHLKKHQQVQINGLGTFAVEHQKQAQKQEKDGRIIITPPADVLVFKSGK